MGKGNLNTKIVVISSNSIGGAAYMQRILNAAKHEDNVIVKIEQGKYQNQLYNKLEADIGTLRHVCKLRFKLKLIAEGD